MGTVRAGVVAAMSIFLATALAVAEPALHVRTEKVVVYKNGYALFVKRATGRTDAAGRARIDDVPDGITLGSFWATAGKRALKSITASHTIVPAGGQQISRKALRLQFDPRKGREAVDLGMSHLQPGVRWIPTYRIQLEGDDAAQLAMQAELVNEVEDLDDVQLELVVGVPSFRFQEVASPLSLVASLVNPLLRAVPALMGQAMSNSMYTQRAGEFRGRPGSGGPAGSGTPAVPKELVGGEAHDLFLYRVPDVTIGRGERAVFPLVAAKVPCRHVYTWDFHLSRSGSEPVPGSGTHTSPIKLLKNEVWHQIELTNNTDVPWTTGAAMMTQGYLPLGQDLLTYTPKGGKVRVPLTVAVDVRGTFDEAQIAREAKGIHWSGYEYARVEKRGTLRITNYRAEPVALEVTCELGGTATKASGKGQISVGDYNAADWRNYPGPNGLNAHSTVTWQGTLDAGKTIELTCEYFYYVR